MPAFECIAISGPWNINLFLNSAIPNEYINKHHFVNIGSFQSSLQMLKYGGVLKLFIPYYDQSSPAEVTICSDLKARYVDTGDLAQYLPFDLLSCYFFPLKTYFCASTHRPWVLNTHASKILCHQAWFAKLSMALKTDRFN